MLVEYPYIDAMALFDRRKLIEIGGYDTDLYKFGWFGWEDYDLWLRIAEAKLPVSFLPNVLCLYRHHQRAMSNTTNLFEEELVALIRKTPLADREVPAETTNSWSESLAFRGNDRKMVARLQTARRSSGAIKLS
jgi:hypothetical protein